MAIEQIKKRGNATKRIHNYWCGFCRIEVQKKDATTVPTKYNKHWWHLCPRCGGNLLGDAPGIGRRIFTTR